MVKQSRVAGGLAVVDARASVLIVEMGRLGSDEVGLYQHANFLICDYGIILDVPWVENRGEWTNYYNEAVEIYYTAFFVAFVCPQKCAQLHLLP